jgi:prepilin-type processing-associated H-X9-DG protein
LPRTVQFPSENGEIIVEFYTLWDASGKFSDFRQLPTSKAFTFLDEHPDSIDDGCMWAIDFQNLPTSYHNGACGFAFADGHSEIKKWLDRMTVVPISYQKYPDPVPCAPTLNNVDYTWILQRIGEPGP